MTDGRVELPLPPWLAALNRAPRRFANLAEAMAFAVDAAQRNSQDGGGPFGAVVLDAELHLVAVGVNRVVPLHGSILHAEMLALLLAQGRLGSHDLASLGEYSLVTSCAPCAMCLGALPFAGVRRLVCGARGEDAEAIGFDEGDKPENWPDKLRARGIAVVEDLGRESARAVLDAYRDRGGIIY